MKKNLLFSLLFGAINCAIAQGSGGPPSPSAGQLDINANPGGQVQTIPLKPVDAIGNALLYDAWAWGTITISKEKVIENYLMNYDVEKDEVLIKTAEDVRVLRGYKVESFDISTSNDEPKRHFINGTGYEIDGVPLTGFIEQLVSNKVSLFSRTSVTIKPSTYNIQIDMGERAEEILKEESFYLASDKALIEIDKSKKKALEIFGDKSSQVDVFMKKNKLKFKTREDLIRVIEYYNSINS